ncbi:MAG: LptE family protein [Planctomycetota bacterium]|nr:MAG: LptE family protein [Planctomycetota bacterium]
MKKRLQVLKRGAVGILAGLVVCVLFVCGCGEPGPYSNESLYTDEVGSVYVEMFESRSFRRGVEYELTNAVAKRIEAETPYKVISNRDRADSVLSGQIMRVGEMVLTTERRLGRGLEKEVEVQAVVSWKNLKTGELLIDNKGVSASASYSEWQNQGFDYGSALAANKLAQRIVELMEAEW